MSKVFKQQTHQEVVGIILDYTPKQIQHYPYKPSTFTVPSKLNDVLIKDVLKKCSCIACLDPSCMHFSQDELLLTDERLSEFPVDASDSVCPMDAILWERGMQFPLIDEERCDIQTADMLHLPVPEANFHTEVIRPSQWQRDMIAELAERAERIRNREVDPATDNMLKVTNDGRKLALDQRLINPLLPDDPDGKVAACAANVFRIWEQHREKRLAQLVFCDLSTPKADGTFNVYDDLKAKLMAKGVPEHEISFIHNADTEARKKELFAKVRKGQIRVLMGSTQKMGAGTNVQDKLIALHDLDCPWRPSDLAQRLGRIVRQGNRNPEVEIFRYVTEGTFDSYLYQLVENKQKFISQIMTSKLPVRSAEDVDETALSYAEIKALATGNPLIIEKCQLEMDVNKLKILHASHLSQKYALEELVIRKYPEAIKLLTERLAGYEQDIQLVAAHPKLPEQFPPMEIMGTAYAEKESAGKAIIDACTKMTGSDAVFLGQYRGFSMVLAYDGPSNEYRLTLKGTLSHTAVLGADIYGNRTRIDNVLDGLTTKHDTVIAELDNTRVQLENAKAELAAPFSREAELTEKTARLKELNILLNMDEKDRSLVDAEPDELADKSQRNRDYERGCAGLPGKGFPIKMEVPSNKERMCHGVGEKSILRFAGADRAGF